MKFEVKAKDFREALKACADSVSEHQDRITSCIYIVIKEAMIELISTDGNRLVLRRLVPLRQEGDTVEGRYIIANEDFYKYIDTKGIIELNVTEDALTILDIPFRKEDDDLSYPKVEPLITHYDNQEIGYSRVSANTFSIKLDRKFLISILKDMKSTAKDRDSVVLKFDISDENKGNRPCYIVNGEYDDRVMQSALLMPITRGYYE